MTGVRRYRLPVDDTADAPSRYRVPITFHADVFELLRKRAERERTCIGDVVIELVERGLGG